MHEYVEALVRKYETRNPFELAEKLGIEVIFEDLGRIDSYYNKAFDKKFIHINQNLLKNRYPLSAAIMLYHALKDDHNIIYRRSSNDLFYPNIELDAVRFATILLEHRKTIMSFETKEDSFPGMDIAEKDKEKFYEWVYSITDGIEVPKYKESDFLNRLLYIVSSIEEGFTKGGDARTN